MGDSTKRYDLDGFEQTAFLTSYKEPKSSTTCCGKKCCCCTTSWKCCGITTGAIILFIGLLIGGAAIFFKMKQDESQKLSKKMQEKAGEWDTLLSNSKNTSESSSNEDLITGQYLLVSYDENYSAYLKALGIPGFVVDTFIIGATETLNITRTKDMVTFSTLTDTMARQSEFKLGEIKEHTWGKNSGIIKTNCSIIATNTLYCSSENPVKGTKMTSRYEFSKAGAINIREHVTKEVKAKKFYQRLGEIIDNTFGKNEENIVLIPKNDDSESPFSKDENDAFDFDTWGDDSMDDDDFFEDS